jgi:pyridoxal 5'-phosphate synthase pdxS subunit
MTNKLRKQLNGGVIMDVIDEKQAKIAEASGARSVMALERVPSDIRDAGGVSRMSDPALIEKIQNAVDIPVMAKARIGHIGEAGILEALGIDMIDESEVLTPADTRYHIDKRAFHTPFVCGARNLGEALRRINEGATMIRTKGEAGTGDISEAVTHMRQMNESINHVASLSNDMLYDYAKEISAPYDLIQYVHDHKRLPVLNFAAGGIATPADAVLMMRLGCDGVFVGSGIFKSDNPQKRAKAIVEAVKYFDDNKKVAELSKNLGTAMSGRAVSTLEQRFAGN